MYLDMIAATLQWIGDALWGAPLIIFIVASGIVMTWVLGGVQFRYFFRAWRLVIWPKAGVAGRISPFQAFLNSLSGSVGNGSLTGMATAIYSGGPGAAFWVFVLGWFTMAIRFAEVCAGTFITVTRKEVTQGGPLAYIGVVRGGAVLVPLYLFFCLLLTLLSGNAMQCQAITKGVVRLAPSANMWLVGLFLVVGLLYSMLGGAARVLKLSDAVVPLKVGLFAIAMLGALVYHYDALIPAIQLMISSAFTGEAIRGGAIGFTMQQAIRFGMARSLNATEAGLGTAGILYGGTGSKDPVESGIMAMTSSFMSNHLVCWTIMLLIIASGAWKLDLIGTGMVSAAFETVYGSTGGSLLVTGLSMMFGVGVLITYAYIGRECWIFLTGGRFEWLYTFLYCAMALFGAVADVAAVWNSIDIAVAGLVIINLYALLSLLPRIRVQVREYQARQVTANKDEQVGL